MYGLAQQEAWRHRPEEIRQQVAALRLKKALRANRVPFTFSTKKQIRLGQNIAATATNASTGDTSEFSAPRKVVAR